MVTIGLSVVPTLFTLYYYYYLNVGSHNRRIRISCWSPSLTYVIRYICDRQVQIAIDNGTIMLDTNPSLYYTHLRALRGR